MTWILSGFADEAGSATDEQIKALQRAGFQYVDLRSVEGHNITQLPLDTAKQVQQKLAGAGIKVNMFGSPLGKIDISDAFPSELDRLRHLAKLKPIFNCDRVRVFSYYNKDKAPKDQWRKITLDRLRQLKQVAADEGLVLFHENERHIFGDRGPDVIDLLNELRDDGDQGAFKGIFDFDNYNQSGDDVWDNWQKLRDQTDGFHLKDSDDKHQHMPIGQGHGQAKRILTDALSRNWSGFLSLEPHLTRSPAVVATGPGGQPNQAIKDMSPPDVWQVAAEAAKKLLDEIGAPLR